jgi:RHS repeat-associated protein
LPENLKVVLGATTLANLTHSYDANANITFIDDAVHGSSFDRSMGYDDLDRLTSASGFWGSGTYTFDALGNIKTKSEGGTYYGYYYDANNRLSYVYGPGTGSVYYDARGNVTSHRGHSYTYNLAGNMVSSTNPGISYKYDGHKRRVQKTEGGQTSYTVYGQNGRLLHKRKGGVGTDYIYAGSLLIAKKEGSTVHYLHTDLLGSPIKGDNGPAYTEHYRPWGEKKDHPLQLADDVGYTGHQDDLATGLTYMQARYYDPVIGRFLSNDPVGFTPKNPMSFGRYTYANDNPYKFVDPDGEFANFAIKFIADVAINVAVNYVTTGEANLGGALTESVLSLANPAQSLKKVAKLTDAVRDSRRAQRTGNAAVPGGGGGGRGGNQFRGPDPEANGRPHTRFRSDDKGVTTYETYDYPGPNVGKRVDAVGPPHGGVPTPHTVDVTRHVNPNDPTKSSFRESRPRPSTPDEIPLRRE